MSSKIYNLTFAHTVIAFTRCLSSPLEKRGLNTSFPYIESIAIAIALPVILSAQALLKCKLT